MLFVKQTPSKVVATLAKDGGEPNVSGWGSSVEGLHSAGQLHAVAANNGLLHARRRGGVEGNDYCATRWRVEDVSE